MDEPMAEALSALGVRTAGALAALPPDDVEQRWGRTGLAAWRLARGDDRRRPGLATTEFPRTASADLTPSVETMEPVLFLVRAALDRLLAGLVADGRAAATLAITLTLDDARGAATTAPAHTITREVRLAHPMARLVPLFESCRALLDRWPLPAPACGVTVAVVATAPLAGEQCDLLDPSWHDPAAADAAFARLRAELGADAIVMPVTSDTHRPERAGAWLPMDGGRETGDGRKGQQPALSPVTRHPSDVSCASRQLETHRSPLKSMRRRPAACPLVARAPDAHRAPVRPRAPGRRLVEGPVRAGLLALRGPGRRGHAGPVPRSLVRQRLVRAGVV
jgi:hypothetical protein